MTEKLLAKEAVPDEARAPIRDSSPAVPRFRAGVRQALAGTIPAVAARPPDLRTKSRTWPEGGYRVVFCCHLPDCKS